MSQIIKNVLEKIKENGIKPKPKWIFIFKNLFLWILVPIFIVFGGISFSIIFYMFVSSDWDLQSRVGASFFEFVLKTMPYFWIIILIIFLLVLYFDFKNTKHAYKFSFLKISMFGLGIVMVLGLIFYSCGIAKNLDNSLLKVDTYKTLSCQNSKMWNNPENGILAGKFLSISDNFGTFKDVNEKTWNITFDNRDGLNNLDLSRDIKIIGRKMGDNNFYVEFFRAMRCGCQMKDCNCGNSERNFIDKRSNGCGFNPTTNN